MTEALLVILLSVQSLLLLGLGASLVYILFWLRRDQQHMLTMIISIINSRAASIATGLTISREERPKKGVSRKVEENGHMPTSASELHDAAIATGQVDANTLAELGIETIFEDERDKT
jgi:hypothetical protein